MKKKPIVFMKEPLAQQFASEVLKHATKGAVVQVRGLGTFEIVKITPRTLFHNFSGKVKRIKAYKRLKFSQSKHLKDKISK